MKQSILIIDDEPSNTSFLYLILTKEGYDVTSTNSGISALELIEENNYDAITLDLLMPRLNGQDLFSIFKQKGILEKTAVVIISGLLDINIQKELLSQGASEYIKKPFNPDELLLHIKKALEYKKNEIAYKKTIEELNIQKSITENNINLVKQVQNNCLQKEQSFTTKFQNTCLFYRPRKEISGDTYRIYSIKNCTYITLCDCSGQELFAGFMSIICQDIINKSIIAPDPQSLETIFASINNIFNSTICKKEPLYETIKISIAKLDYSNNILEFAGTQQKMLVKNNDDNVSIIEGNITPFDSLESKEEVSIQIHTEKLSTIKSILLYSAGLEYQYNSELTKTISSETIARLFKEENLFEDGKKKIEKFIDTWKGEEPQTDDITVLAFEPLVKK